MSRYNNQINLKNRLRAVTLLELLIAIILLAMVGLAVANIDIFSRNQVLSTDRYAKVQNEVSNVVEHMTKSLLMAIGNDTLNGADKIVLTTPITGLGQKALRVYIDANNNGRRDEPKADPLANEDHWVAYTLYDDTGGTDRNTIKYCSRCQDELGNCTTCLSVPEWEIIGRNITNLAPFKAGRQVWLNVFGCFDPTNMAKIGTSDNPEVALVTIVDMPMVTTE